MYCTKFYCYVLYFVMNCNVLQVIKLYFTVIYCILNCIVLLSTNIYCTVLRNQLYCTVMYLDTEETLVQALYS